MTREKMKHEYITDEAKRKVSFRKRKGSIMKKIHELSILCGVPATAVVYCCPTDPQPEVWPDPEGARNVIERYRAKPVLDKTLNQEAFIRQRINKERERLKKRCKENYEEEINQLILNCLGGQTQPNLSMQYAADMKTAIDQHLKLLNMMMEASNKGVEEDYVPAPPASESLLITGENKKLMDQTLQYVKDPNKEVEFYVPAPPMSNGLPINGENEKLDDQILQYGLDSDNFDNPPWWKNIDNMEEYMGFGASDMPPPFSSGNYQNASSSYNPFSP